MQRYAEGYVKKDYSGSRKMPRIALVTGCVLLGALLAVTLLYLMGLTIYSYVFAAALFLCTLFLLKFLWRYVDIAYEYILVEDELRVVKILGDVVRRPIVTVPLRSVKEKGKLSALNAEADVVYDALSAPDAEDACYVLFVENDTEALLLWNGKEKILSLMPWGRTC